MNKNNYNDFKFGKAEKYELIDFAIEKLNELLIKQEFEDRKKKSKTYVKKTRCYKDLIKLLKDVKEYWHCKYISVLLYCIEMEVNKWRKAK